MERANCTHVLIIHTSYLEMLVALGCSQATQSTQFQMCGTKQCTAFSGTSLKTVIGRTAGMLLHDFADVPSQDDVKECPSDKVPQHYSGVVGDVPCQQMIVQLKRKPDVDKTGVL